MRIRHYILLNVGLAALTGLFNGPFFFLLDNARKIKTKFRTKAKPDLESVTPLCGEWVPEMHGYGYRGEEVIKKCTRSLGHSGRHRGCGRVWEEGEGRSHDAAMD